MTSGAAVLDLEPVRRLTRDLKVAAIALSSAELGKERARELVNSVVPEGAVTSEHLATIAQLTHRKLESIERERARISESTIWPERTKQRQNRILGPLV